MNTTDNDALTRTPVRFDAEVFFPVCPRLAPIAFLEACTYRHRYLCERSFNPLDPADIDNNLTVSPAGEHWHYRVTVGFNPYP